MTICAAPGYSRWFLPVAFFAGAILSGVEMEIAIGDNIQNSLRQLVFSPPKPRHLPGADFWFWVMFVCFIIGLAFTWRAFRQRKHVLHA
jgi:hypothetical protein